MTEELVRRVPPPAHGRRSRWKGPRAPALLLPIAAAVLCAGITSPIAFEDISQHSGVAFVLNNHSSPSKHQIEAMIAGVALFDYNNDGLLDIYFVNGADIPSLKKSGRIDENRLYRNNGNGTFTDVTEAAGVAGEGFSMGAAAGDYDNDGNVDLYVAGVNQNLLYHNNGDGTFTDVSSRAGVSGIHPQLGKLWSVSAGWFDYDNDGSLDLLVVNYVKWAPELERPCVSRGIRAYCSPDSYSGVPNFLYHNNGDGTFTDVSERSGIGRYTGKGMGVAFADYDNDGFTDAFVSNDTFRHFLFHNNGNGTFSEVAVMNGVAYNEHGKSVAGMGVDFRDVDNDGKPDIWVVAMTGDTFPFYRNRGRGFADITSTSGIARASAGTTAWGSGVFDFDNDGFKDLFASCASVLDNSEEIDRLPSKLPNLLLRNLGNGNFVNVSAEGGTSFRVPRLHRGAAFGDLDNDGRVDAVVTNIGEQPEILMNRSAGGHWLLIRLVGAKSNRDGLGARVRITAGGRTQYNQATTSVGYASSSDRRVHFGLGSAISADELEIVWPGGKTQRLRNVKADQILTIREEP